MINSEIFDPLGDGKSRLELIDCMGNDLSVVNDAKASFENFSTEIGERELKLLRFLLTGQPVHKSPLRGVVFKFKVKAPLQTARQWWKHVLASNHNDEQIGWNERSFRYTQAADADDFYIPKEFSIQDLRNKQASGGPLAEAEQWAANKLFTEAVKTSYDRYTRLIELGVSRDQARGVLVPSVYTSWVWTVSLESLMNFIYLRVGNGASNEIAKYAEALAIIVEQRVPHTYKIWHEHTLSKIL